jgi:predicted Zn-dependent protease
MYKTGYDPEAFVDFFEKVQSQEKRKPGSVSKLFSSHPPTAERVKAAQENIQNYLKERPEYVVSTSEFNDIKARVLAMHGRKSVASTDPKDAGKPTLRRNPNGTIDESGQEKAPAPDADDRPTLKRRDTQ